MKKCYFWNIVFLLFLAVFDARAEGNETALNVPFSHGEKLVYAVEYFGITAGEGVLSVSKPILLNGRSVYPLLSTIQSGPYVSRIYPVNDRVASYMDAEEFYSHRIDVQQQEGRRKREKRIDFDQQRHKATQTKNNQREVFDIPPRVHDFLSILYYLRTHPLKTGRSIFVDVHESGKNWKVETRVLGKEKVTTPSGTFDTLQVQVASRFEGMFLTKRDLFLWITEDCHKIPVRIQSKIGMGSMTLDLTGMEKAPCLEPARG